MERVETLVVGGGQAGLATSHHLKQSGQEHLVLERGRVAERWRTQRWDSLMFQFPDWSVELPGHRLASTQPDAFSHKDRILAFLEEYRAIVAAPVRTGVEVTALRPAVRSGHHLVETMQGSFEARNVVVATGPYQRPKVPALASRLPRRLVHVHAGDYRNPQLLPPGGVLVVGTGASGCQIAEELLDAGRAVYLAVGRHRRIPRRYRGRDAFWWRREMGHLDLAADEIPPGRRMPPPLVTGVAGGHDIDLREYAARGMRLLGHVLDVDGERLALAPDLEASLAAGDRACDEFVESVDAFILRTGLAAPPPEHRPRSAGAAECPPELDLRKAGVGAVVWATGYTRDFGWIEGLDRDDRGDPVHRRGITATAGLYFVGLPWLHKVKSTFLCGVGEDAAHIAAHIAQRSLRAAAPTS